uniref:Uncharacterized protein n=1 Tax=Candidatus Kentrum sp. MB TaxID=2138164 RepID=A0A450XFZ7_9GAMM|nr:MAG: hypothetical protein BECKMB1821G_GA0114241_10348 [Candidatus Kentron sp. MB]
MNAPARDMSPTVVPINPSVAYEMEIRERIVRVEEELKNQRELMKLGFEQMDKRLEQMDKRIDDQREATKLLAEQIDKRFDQVDKRFEDQREAMKHGFEQMDKRFKQTFAFVTTAALIAGALISAFNYLHVSQQ